MASKIPDARNDNPLMLLIAGAIIFLIVFGGVPIAWLSKHGAEYGLGELSYALRELLFKF